MSARSLTEQEKFWAGDFGDAYIERNRADSLIESNFKLFERALRSADTLGSVIEFGANIGLNLKALLRLLPHASLTGLEINARAVGELRKVEGLHAIHGSIHDFQPVQQYDLAFTKTVLIHINPDLLPRVYDALYRASRRYVMVVEYYNPKPTEVTYRGHEQRLFKRDFAGELLDRFSDLRLLDYGFWYHRDRHFQDDVTWFLLEKAGA